MALTTQFPQDQAEGCRATVSFLTCQTDVAEVITPASLLPAARLSLLLFGCLGPPCSFVADVIHWCGLFILQSGVFSAASLCSPSVRSFVPRRA